MQTNETCALAKTETLTHTHTRTLDGGGFYYIALPPSRAHNIHMRIYEFRIRIGPGSVTYTHIDDAGVVTAAAAVGGSCHVFGYHHK